MLTRYKIKNYVTSGFKLIKEKTSFPLHILRRAQLKYSRKLIFIIEQLITKPKLDADDSLDSSAYLTLRVPKLTE